MTEALRRAVELAQQLPDDEQDTIAQIILDEIEEREWDAIVSKPSVRAALESMAEAALKEHEAGQTRDLDELL